MIHDAKVEITCDGEFCTESVFVGLVSDEEVERIITQDYGWFIDDGRHFCCVECCK